MFTIKPIANKGQGWVATQNIPNNTRLLLERPLFTLREGNSEASVKGKVGNLTPAQTTAFFSLFNAFPEKPEVEGIVATNSFPVAKGSGIKAVYTSTSRINHSCQPNAERQWDGVPVGFLGSGKGVVRTIREIAEGEEITISYFPDKLKSYAIRQKELKGSFRFDCRCELCRSQAPGAPSSQ